MGVWDRIGQIGEHLLHGDLKGALGEIGDIADEALGGPPKGHLGPPQMGLFSPLRMPTPNEFQAGAQMGVINQQNPMSGKQDGAKQACCNRFSMNDGFLVDGVTGRVWQFNTATNKLDEIAVKNDTAKQDLIDSMLENKLSSIRAQYESEVLATVPRQTHLVA